MCQPTPKQLLIAVEERAGRGVNTSLRSGDLKISVGLESLHKNKHRIFWLVVALLMEGAFSLTTLTTFAQLCLLGTHWLLHIGENSPPPPPHPSPPHTNPMHEAHTVGKGDSCLFGRCTYSKVWSGGSGERKTRKAIRRTYIK